MIMSRGLNLSPSTTLLEEQEQEQGVNPSASNRQKLEATDDDVEDSQPGNSNNNNNNSNSNVKCAVCLGIARLPVFTCCGHLFCWRCLYLCFKSDKDRNCPVCRGRVPPKKVFPLYVGGNDVEDEEDDRNEGIPPRPKAQRLKSSRERVPVRRSRIRTSPSPRSTTTTNALLQPRPRPHAEPQAERVPLMQFHAGYSSNPNIILPSMPINALVQAAHFGRLYDGIQAVPDQTVVRWRFNSSPNPTATPTPIPHPAGHTATNSTIFN
eukprot:Gb_30243 [translate_table: standard]